MQKDSPDAWLELAILLSSTPFLGTQNPKMILVDELEGGWPLGPNPFLANTRSQTNPKTTKPPPKIEK